MKKIWSPLFFCLSFLVMELLLRVMDGSTVFWEFGLIRSIFAALCMGLFFSVVCTLIPHKTVAQVLATIFMALISIIFMVMRCTRSFFGVYYQIAYLLSMTSAVATDFMDNVIFVIKVNWWYLLLMLVPTILLIVFRRHIIPEFNRREQSTTYPLILASSFIIALTIAIGLCNVGPDVNYGRADYESNVAASKFGLINSVRIEIKQAIFGKDTINLDDDDFGDSEVTISIATKAPAPTAAPEQTSEAEATPEPTATPEPKVYYPNVTSIDFEALKASTKSDNFIALDEYFSTVPGTMQNDYTGIFEDKNLIYICAEGFCSYVIDEQRTPALYRLANNGFVFTNYYQPDWTQSTTGGEFAFMTGLVPTWVNSKTSFNASVGNLMPLCLGHMFKNIGYTTTAYHNNSYTYYGRNETHPALGYDYYGIGNGLVLPNNLWPNSDLEMLQVTLDDKINDFVNNGQNYHLYYMTVSGHCNYNFTGNKMSKKNQDLVADMEATEPVRAYYACQQELEYAMEYLLERLEATDTLKDTVVVMSADHYPYALSSETPDYYIELSGVNDTKQDTSRYRNTLILWCGDIETPIVIDRPCSAIDVVPTVLNLFGMEYDSRLYAGRDILAPAPEDYNDTNPSMPVVVFANSGYGQSWITEAATYEAGTKTLIVHDGYEIDEGYFDRVKKIVSKKTSVSKSIISCDYYRHVFGK